VCLLKTYLLSGRSEEGLAATQEGLKMLETHLARRARSDLLRLQGEFLLQRGELDAARTSLERALAEARDSGATLHELRAALSLALLLRRSGGGDEAHPLLSEVLDRCTADIDLRDYKAAREFLAETPGHEIPPGETPGRPDR
jgi:tetratricopeptide (TPR) repeat protein